MLKKYFSLLISLLMGFCCLGLTLPVYAQEESDSETITALDYATLAVQYALPDRTNAYGTTGSALYKQLHDDVFPWDSYYASCDRSVTTAIVASGADPDMPAGPCLSIEAHMQESDLWQLIGYSTTVEYEDLEPGDIFIIGSYHVFMYVGYDLVSQIHGTVGDTVEGALCFSMSPACYPTTDYTYQQGRVDYNGYGPYSIYRYQPKGLPAATQQKAKMLETVEDDSEVEEELTEQSVDISKNEEETEDIEKPLNTSEKASLDESDSDLKKKESEEKEKENNKSNRGESMPLTLKEAEKDSNPSEETSESDLTQEDSTKRASTNWLKILLWLFMC